MTHEMFRMLIPGLIFWTPVFCVLFASMPDKLPIIGSLLAATVLPTGWFLYSGYRVFLFKCGKTYEQKTFIAMLRDRLKAVYVPYYKEVIVDFAGVRPDFGKWRMDINTFLETFNPFRKRTTNERIDEHVLTSIPFLEPLSDLYMFQEESYDYARSIASIRYGINCSLFSFIFGFTAAVGIYLWLEATGFWKLLGGGLLLTVLFTTVYMLWQRGVYASAEYNARLNLITLSRFGFAKMKVDQVKITEFEDILVSLRKIDDLESRIAVFDLDNTLLIGDIQGALLAKLLFERKIRNFCFSDYTQILEEDITRAYKMAVQALAGLKVSTIEKMTRSILSDLSPCVRVEDIEVPIPRPHPAMQRLVACLQLMGIECFVVSASNQTSVEICSWEFFGIPSRNAIGMKSKIRSGWRGRIFTSELEEPAPIFDGKPQALARRADDKKPVLLAGDSTSDYPLLSLCPQDGKVLWVGTTASQAKVVEKDLNLAGQVEFLKRDSL